MRGLACLNHRAKIVDPVQSRFVSFETSEQAVDAIRSLSDGFGEFGPDELRSIICGQSIPVLVSHEGQILLDVVSKDQDVGMLATQCQQFLSIEVPDLIVEVLNESGVTFMRRTEYALVVSAATITKSFPLRAIKESI